MHMEKVHSVFEYLIKTMYHDDTYLLLFDKRELRNFEISCG